MLRRAAPPLSRYAWRNPDGNLSSSGQAWVTVFSMTVTGIIGFWYQTRLINEHFGGPDAQLNAKIKEIKRLEMLEIQLQAERESQHMQQQRQQQQQQAR